MKVFFKKLFFQAFSRDETDFILGPCTLMHNKDSQTLKKQSIEQLVFL